MYGVSKSLDEKPKIWKDNVYDPTLLAFGKNLKEKYR